MKFKRIITLLLAVLLLLTSYPGLFAAEIPAQTAQELLTQKDKPITRAQFAMLINNSFSFETAADVNFLDVGADYPYARDLLIAKGTGYISGDGFGNANPDRIMSGAEAAVIINNILGFDASKAPPVSDANIPDWAKPSASVLFDLQMVPKETVSKKELTVKDSALFIDALQVAVMFQGSPYALSQANLKDDYYAYTNRAYLATAVIEPGDMYAMAFANPEITVKDRQALLLQEILTDSGLIKGSDEWKISELHKMYMDKNARTASFERLKPYFDEIRAVNTISEFTTIAQKYIKYFTIQPFYELTAFSDARVDASQWAAFVLPVGLALGTKDYYAENEALLPIQDAYRDYIKNVLEYIGETENLSERAAVIFNTEKERAEKSPDPSAYANPDVMYNKTTWEEMNELTQRSNTLTYAKEVYDILKSKNIYCPSIDYIKYAEGLFIQENLQMLKDYAMINIFSTASTLLGDETRAMFKPLQKVMFGEVGADRSLTERALSFVTSQMSVTFSNVYAKKYGSEKIKADVSQIVEDIRDKYRERIRSLDWMGEDTKKEAIIKLDSIKAYVAYPDTPVKGFAFDVKGTEDGGSLIDLIFTKGDANYSRNIEALSRPNQPNLWDSIPVTTVNAFYSATENAIIIPMGILDDPLYNPDNSREKNLGGVGAIIAHEFSHAFDNSGAQYDKDGTLVNWWTEKDYAAFREKSVLVAKKLSQIVVMGGSAVNGPRCTGETIADLGAMACIMDIVNDTPGANPAEAMEAWSAIWAARMSPEVTAYLLSAGPHAPNKVRTNFVLSQIDDFYSVYDIKETDGMYVRKSERISIW